MNIIKDLTVKLKKSTKSKYQTDNVTGFNDNMYKDPYFKQWAKEEKIKSQYSSNKLKTANQIYFLTSVALTEDDDGNYISPRWERLQNLQKLTNGKNEMGIDDGLLKKFYKYAIKHAPANDIFADWSEKRFYEYRLKIYETYAYSQIQLPFLTDGKDILYNF